MYLRGGMDMLVRLFPRCIYIYVYLLICVVLWTCWKVNSQGIYVCVYLFACWCGYVYVGVLVPKSVSL